jgi:hypothetical protein
MVRGDWRKESQSILTTHKILVLVRGDWREESQSILTTHKILVLVRGDWREESQSIITTHKILVLVRGDWREESQSILTTQEFWFWLKRIGERNLSFTQPYIILCFDTKELPNGVSGQPSFEKISVGNIVLFIFTTLTMQILCFVSIVKRGATVITHFWIPAQKRRKYKKNQKNISKKIEQ